MKTTTQVYIPFQPKDGSVPILGDLDYFKVDKQQKKGNTWGHCEPILGRLVSSNKDANPSQFLEDVKPTF